MILHYNVPSPTELSGLPAYCVGACLSDKNGLKFIVKRDLNIKLDSIDMAFRFSDRSIHDKDPDNRFKIIKYRNPEINFSEYLLIDAPTPEFVPPSITAVIASVITDSGAKKIYDKNFYVDPACPIVRRDDTETASESLKEWFGFVRAHSSSSEQASPVLTKAPGASPDSGTTPQRISGAADARNEGPLADLPPYGKKQLSIRRNGLNTALIAFLIAVPIISVLIAIISSTIRSNMNAPGISELLGSENYSAAYKLAISADDRINAQEICRRASAKYISEGNYEKAFAYASAAPASFASEVMNSLVRLLISEDRCEEAYEFLKDKPDFSDSMNTVLFALVDKCIEAHDYNEALVYAEKAPESLETYVIETIAGTVAKSGSIGKEIIDAVKSLKDPDGFDRMAKNVTESFISDGSYLEAAAITLILNNEDEKTELIGEIFANGIDYHVRNKEISKAGYLFDFCTPYIDTALKNQVLSASLENSTELGITAGIIFFTKRNGESTEAIAVSREDESIREAQSLVWFMLTEEQKRAYHAREFDLYKEAFRITDGKLGDITNAVSVAVSEKYAVVLTDKGQAVTINENGKYKTLSIPSDGGTVQIDAGRDHILMLKNDGTVAAAGANTFGQCNTSEWTDVVKIAAGADFSAALRSDGTLYACGSNLSGQCQIEGISNIIDIAATDSTLVLLTSDRSVKLIGDIFMGYKAAEKLENISVLRAGGTCILVKDGNGDFHLADGTQNADCGSVDGFIDPRDFAAGSVCIGRIEQNGSMLIEGEGAPIIHTGYNPNGE